MGEAVASVRTALTLRPGRIGAQLLIGTARLQGEPEEALATILQEPFEAFRLLGLVYAHHALGQAASRG